MKNDIIVISPIYKIIGRSELNRDTECVHDLIKYWTKDHNLYVFFPYVRGLKRLPYFFKKDQLNYYLNGYDYECDNIKVRILERQNLFPNQMNGFKSEKKRFRNLIKQKISDSNINPNLVVVHIPSSSCFFFKKDMFMCKTIAVLHYSDVKYYNKYGKKFIEYLNENFDAVFCRSKSLYEIFNKLGIKNLRGNVIYSGVPNDKSVLQKDKFNGKKNKFLYVGKLIKRKNLDLLIKALSNFDVDTWELNVIGAGPFEKEYKNLVKKLSLEKNVNFLGTFNKKKVFEYMSESDIFCMPSVKETLGLVYLEAMMNGCITIGTINEGIDGIIVDGKNGFLVSPSVESIISIISRIYAMDDKSKKAIIENAINTGLYYNEDDMSKKYKKIIDGV